MNKQSPDDEQDPAKPPVERLMPIEMFESCNQATCKICGCSFYWVWVGKIKKYMPYDILTRKPHPDCWGTAKIKVYRYK